MGHLKIPMQIVPAMFDMFGEQTLPAAVSRKYQKAIVRLVMIPCILTVCPMGQASKLPTSGPAYTLPPIQQQADPQQSAPTNPSANPDQDRKPIGKVGPSPSLKAPTPDATTNQQTNQSASQAGESPANPGVTPPPVGTAAAPIVRGDGVPVSRPAGAAIAAGKQHRKRTLAIRVGLIVGAAVAVGAVTAASLSSPSRPH